MVGEPKSPGGLCSEEDILGKVTLISESRKKDGAYFEVGTFPLYLSEGRGHKRVCQAAVENGR
eukprot:14321690-Ditylum_brightwellii.AAC.1